MSGGGQNTDPQSMDYPKMDYTNVIEWSGLENRVNQAWGQFSKRNNPKWSLIHSVSLTLVS